MGNIQKAHAIIYVWNGSISSAWNVTANWSPATGIPGNADQVYINNALVPNPCNLDSNRTITSLFLSAGVFDLGGFILTTTTSFSATGGTLQNGFVSATNISNLRSTTCNGLVSITKTGGSSNTFFGGNTFNGPFILINNDDNIVTMASSSGDTFLSTVEIVVTNAGRVSVGASGINSFSDNIKINCSGSGGVVIGNTSATSSQSSGSLITDGFASGPLTLNRFIQSSTQSNGSFNPTTFTATNSAFNGNINVTASSTITISGSSFRATNNFIGATNILISNTCEFSTNSGSTTFIKNGGTSNSWTGNISFGNVSVTNNSASILSVCNSTASSFTYLSSANFINNSTGRIQVTNRGISTFSGDVIINNSGSGGIRFGETGGTTVLTAGSLLTTGFTTGPLVVNNLTQSTSIDNGSFNPTTFSCRNTIINGSFAVKTTTGTLSITSSIFTSANSFESAGNLLVSGVNNFSTTSGTTTFQKNGGSRNRWPGGNVFGNAVFINNSAAEWYMASSLPDDFNGNATFRQMSTGGFYPALNGENTFSGDISTTGTQNIIYFAVGNGRMVIDGASTQTLSGSSSFIPATRRLTMRTSGSGNLQLACPFNVLNDLTLTSGIIHTDTANIITLTDDSVTTTIGNSISYIDGPMQYNMDNNSASKSTLNFPIGKQNDWRPAILKLAHSSTTKYTYRAEVFNASARGLNYALPPTVDSVSDVHYWDVARYLTSTMIASPTNDLITGPGNEPSIILSFDVGDWVYDGSNLTIVKNTASDPASWFDVGGLSVAGTSNIPIAGTVESTSSPTPINSFGRFTLGSMLTGNNPLPVGILNCNVKSHKSGVLVNWTSNENTDQLLFTIEKSTDGIVFIPIKSMNAVDAVYLNNTYQYVDVSPASGRVFYRIKQNKTGKFVSYSNIASLFMQNEQSNSIRIYPNPSVSSGVILEFANPLKQSTVKITDEKGSLVVVKYLGDVFKSVYLPETARLSKGTYWIKVTEESNPSFYVGKLQVK